MILRIIGHAFIILSAFLLGAKYGGLTGAVGLALADILVLCGFKRFRVAPPVKTGIAVMKRENKAFSNIFLLFINKNILLNA